MKRNNPVPAAPADLDRVVHLAKVAADHVVITGSFHTHSDEIRAAVTEAFRCALGSGLIEIVPTEKWPEYVWLDPPYRPASPPKAAAP